MQVKITLMVSAAATFNSYLPSRPEVAPVIVPPMRIDTNSNGSLFSSVTIPVIFTLSAHAPTATINAHINRKKRFLIIIYLNNI